MRSLTALYAFAVDGGVAFICTRTGIHAGTVKALDSKGFLGLQPSDQEGHTAPLPKQNGASLFMALDIESQRAVLGQVTLLRHTLQPGLHYTHAFQRYSTVLAGHRRKSSGIARQFTS